MATPTGIVHAAEISSAAFTRRNVAAAPSSSSRSSGQVTVLSRNAACTAPQHATPIAATAQRPQPPELLPRSSWSSGMHDAAFPAMRHPLEDRLIDPRKDSPRQRAEQGSTCAAASESAR
jgi:hypothetical protein